MKKSVKVLLATLALTILCVTPVFATEEKIDAETTMLTNKVNGFGNDISSLVKFDDKCGAADVASMNLIVNSVAKDVTSSNIAEQTNYINYLKAVVGNAIETERVKKQNVDSLKELVKVNTSFQPQLDAAVAEYNKAVADHAAADKAVVDAQAFFAALNNQFHDNAIAKAAGDPQAVIGK